VRIGAYLIHDGPLEQRPDVLNAVSVNIAPLPDFARGDHRLSFLLDSESTSQSSGHRALFGQIERISGVRQTGERSLLPVD